MSIVLTNAFGQNSGSGPAALLPGSSNTSESMVVQANNSAAPFVLQPPIDLVNGRRVTVRASGYLFLHGSSPTINVGLRGIAGGVPSSAATTPSTYTALLTRGSALSGLTTATWYPWTMTVDLEGDTKSGIVQGAGSIQIANSFTAAAAIANELTGVAFSSVSASIPGSDTAGNATSAPPYTLVATATFGVGDALNQFVVSQFELDS